MGSVCVLFDGTTWSRGKESDGEDFGVTVDIVGGGGLLVVVAAKQSETSAIFPLEAATDLRS
jgi:hypothetical protein